MSNSSQMIALYELQYYWPGISRLEAEEILKKQDGDSFLVRDSSTYHHCQCVSVKQEGRFFHCVIPYSGHDVGQFVLSRPEGWHKSVREILQRWATDIRPVYRCRTLQEICRGAIWRCCSVGHVTLPEHLLLYLYP